MSRLLASIIILIFFPCFAYQHGGVLLIIGTRPESIKMSPVYHALKQLGIPVRICSTDQHADLLRDSLTLFNIAPDFHLNIMKKDQDLFYVTTTALERLKLLYQDIKPDLVLVQGDTTTALAGAMAAFYLKIPVGHVEAGLRTYNIHGPFPEEFNRRAIALIASYHFAPTSLAADCLRAEHVDTERIFNVGNTVVDSLRYIQRTIADQIGVPSPMITNIFCQARKQYEKVVLLTAHRRESFGESLKAIFTAIKQVLQKYPHLLIVYPMHPNPIIKKIAHDVGLDRVPNMVITAPLPYLDTVYLLCNVDAVATDSGGIQEEAISVNKPVLVLRNETERREGVLAGIARLVGDNQDAIITEFDRIMHMQDQHDSFNVLYGNGDAGMKIARIIQKVLSEKKEVL